MSFLDFFRPKKQENIVIQESITESYTDEPQKLTPQTIIRSKKRNYVNDITKNVNERFKSQYVLSDPRYEDAKLSDAINNYSSTRILEYIKYVEPIDMYLASIINARISAVSSLNWAVFSTDDCEIEKGIDEEYPNITEYVHNAMENIKEFYQDIEEIARCIAHGYSVTQIIYEYKDGWLFPKMLKSEYPELYEFDDGLVDESSFVYDNCLVISYDGSTDNFEPIPKRDKNKFIVTTFDKRNENRRGYGLYQKTMFATYKKVNVWSWFMNFLERSGAGVWILKPSDPNFIPQKNDGTYYTSSELTTLLDNLAVTSRAYLGNGLELLPLQFDKDSDVNMFLETISEINDEQTMIVNAGQTETTGDNKYGTRASAEVYESARFQKTTIPDAKLVYSGINDVMLRTCLEWNFGKDAADEWLRNRYVGAKLPEISKEKQAEVKNIDADTEKKKAETLEIMFSLGFKPTEIPVGYESITTSLEEEI